MARKVFPITAVLMVILALFLFFVYGLSQSDYQLVCPGLPIYPRCASDLNVMVQIEALGAGCVGLMIGGALLDHRFRGAFRFISLLVLIIMAAYVLHWFV